MATVAEVMNGKETDKNTDHSYADVYEEYFKDIRYTAKEILEIGIMFGGSIATWHEYFPNARITCLDTDIRQLRHGIFKARIRTIMYNAYCEEIVKDVSDVKYDVIIDDGPHSLESMKYVAQHYSKLLNKNGILVIEDVQSLDWFEEIRDSFPEEYQKYVKLVDLRHVKGRYDDILIVLKLSDTNE